MIWVQPDGTNRTPVADIPRPALRVASLGSGVDEASLAQDDGVLVAVPLSRRHEANAAMAVFLVIPVHETLYLGTDRALV